MGHMGVWWGGLLWSPCRGHSGEASYERKGKNESQRSGAHGLQAEVTSLPASAGRV